MRIYLKNNIKKRLLLQLKIFRWFVFILPLWGFSQIPNGYYDGTEGLSGEALKTTLHNIIKGHTELSYDDVKYALKITDKDTLNTNNVICFYTGWSYDADDFGNGATDWNREHVWSKSHGDFGNDPPCGTDLHQLRPADASVNSAKNNRDFDWGTTEYLDGGTLHTGCYTATNVWEPRDEVKGDVARIIFYMATRYEGDNGEPDLEVVDYVNTAENNEPLYGKLSTLLSWHHSDPVDDWERNRNNIVYDQYQHNRNPFIDHPEFVDSIWGVQIMDEPSNHVSNFMVTSVSDSSITLGWDVNDGTVPAQGYLLMVNTTGVFTAPQDGVEQPDDQDLSDGTGNFNLPHSINSFTCGGLQSGTLYYFIIYPFNNSGSNIDYKTDGNVPQTQARTDTASGYPVLIISEVADPSDVYQARFVEITNIGTADADLQAGGWHLCRQANGSSWGSIELNGVIRKDSSIVIAYNASYFESNYGMAPDKTSGYITGTGNDGYFLYKNGDNTNGILIDAYGEIDIDGSGTDWEYTDSRAYRIYDVKTPSTNWNKNEWVIESATTQDMTPRWHKKTLTWTGSVSGDFMNKDNWENDVTLKVARYKPDASCKLIIKNKGNPPVLNSDFSVSTLELDEQATFEISNNARLFILNGLPNGKEK